MKNRSIVEWPRATLPMSLIITLGLILPNAQPVCAAPPVASVTAAAATPPTVTPTKTLVDIQNDFTAVARSIEPAVVSITSRQSSPQSRQMVSGKSSARLSPVAISTGSGFIIRSDGYIVTNDHVVAEADSVTVRLNDGREFTGSVRRDFYSDLAVVKIPATALPTLSLADTAPTQVGQWALAFGSPFALNDTMTVGIVSAQGRAMTIAEDGAGVRAYPELLQTDAAINPGNSGGPLADIYGRIIGVTVAIDSPIEGSVGIGFAIPSRTVRAVTDQLIASGRVTRGYLGFSAESLTRADAESLGVAAGAIVTSIADESPATEAGLCVEDVVTAWNGTPVTNAAALRELVQQCEPGTAVTLTIHRQGEGRSLHAVVSALSIPRRVARTASMTSPSRPQRLGIEFASGEGGVTVTDVADGGPADEAGVREGDVLLRIGKQTIRTPDDVAEAERQLPPGQRITLVVKREDETVLLRTHL